MSKLAIAAVAAAFVAAPAIAEDSFSFEFAFSPEEAQTEAGAQAIYDRLETAIAEACADQPTTGSVAADLRIADKCEREAMSVAMEQFEATSVAEAFTTAAGG
ncbi:MAG: UrcA family protein [Pseudomonadota bacterium]